MICNLKPTEIQALVSALLVSIVLGSLYTFGAIAPYITSYLFYKNETQAPTNIELSLVFAFIIVMEDIGLPIEAFASRYLSNRIECLISVIGLSLSIFCASFMQTFIGIVIFMGVINGICIGFGYLPPIKNAYSHLPDRKGFCAGFCLSGFGIGTIIFNYMLVALINPDDVKVGDNKMFPK